MSVIAVKTDSRNPRASAHSTPLPSSEAAAATAAAGSRSAVLCFQLGSALAQSVTRTRQGKEEEEEEKSRGEARPGEHGGGKKRGDFDWVRRRMGMACAHAMA